MPTNHNRSDDSRIIESRIRSLLVGTDLSTNELASLMNEDKGRVYYHCRWLEEHGWLESALVDGAKLLYCLDDEMVVTGATYDGCERSGHHFTSFYTHKRIWHVPPGRKATTGH